MSDFQTPAAGARQHHFLSLYHTTPEDLNELSMGVALYFSFLRETAFFFCALTVLVAPQIAYYASGSVYSSGVNAATGLERLTLGNFGPLYGMNMSIQVRSAAAALPHPLGTGTLKC